MDELDKRWVEAVIDFLKEEKAIAKRGGSIAPVGYKEHRELVIATLLQTAPKV